MQASAISGVTRTNNQPQDAIRLAQNACHRHPIPRSGVEHRRHPGQAFGHGLARAGPRPSLSRAGPPPRKPGRLTRPASPHDRPLTPSPRQNWRFGPVSRTVRAVQRTAASPQGYVSQVACRPAPSSRIRRRDFLSRTSFVAQTRPGASGVVKFRYSQRGSRERWGHHAIVSFARPFRRARRVRASRTTGVPT